MAITNRERVGKALGKRRQSLDLSVWATALRKRAR